MVFSKSFNKVFKNGRVELPFPPRWDYKGHIYPSPWNKHINYVWNSGFQNTGQKAVKDWDLWAMGHKPAEPGVCPSLLSDDSVSSLLCGKGTSEAECSRLLEEMKLWFQGKYDS